MSFPSVPSVILTFDDAVSNHATFVAPYLKQLGFGATFYITEMQGAGTNRFDTDKNQYLTWEQIREIHELGFEIGNHTAHHSAVHSVDRPALIEAIAYIEHRCAEHGIPRPETFCFPGGAEHPSALPVLTECGYALARGCGDRAYRPAQDSPLSVPSFVIREESEALFYQALEAAKGEEIVVFTFHGVPDYNHPWVTTPRPMFEKMMTHLQQTGRRVGAMRELLSLA